jgi:hypothetical protein
LTPADKPAVAQRLAEGRARLKAAQEAKDRVKARHARRTIRRAKSDQRKIARLPVPEAAGAAE